jgi:hypothetical protein
MLNSFLLTGTTYPPMESNLNALQSSILLHNLERCILLHSQYTSAQADLQVTNVMSMPSMALSERLCVCVLQQYPIASPDLPVQNCSGRCV